MKRRGFFGGGLAVLGGLVFGGAAAEAGIFGRRRRRRSCYVPCEPASSGAVTRQSRAVLRAAEVLGFEECGGQPTVIRARLVAPDSYHTLIDASVEINGTTFDNIVPTPTTPTDQYLLSIMYMTMSGMNYTVKVTAYWKHRDESAATTLTCE